MQGQSVKRWLAVWSACLGALVWCLPLAAQPSAEQQAPASDAVQSEYRTTMQKAVAEFSVGHWTEARALFLRGHRLWPSARSFRSLGMTSFELRTYARAVLELQAALDDPRRPIPDDQRVQVAGLLQQANVFVGRYLVHTAPAAAPLLIDDAPATIDQHGVVLLDVGHHELLVRATGYQALSRSLQVQGREDETLEFALQPLAAQPPPAAPAVARANQPQPTPIANTPSRRGTRTWTWIAAGAALALGAASTVLWLDSSAAFKHLRARCDVEVCVKGQADESSFADPQTAHHVTLALALGAGVGAVALFFLEPGTEHAPATRVSVGFGVLRMRGSF